MSHFPKPEEGSWTEHYAIDTAPMSYEDSISPEHYELEREAIFKRSWINVGRTNQLRNDQHRYTQDIVIAEVTVLVTEGTDGKVSAFQFPIGEDPSTADLTSIQVDVWEGSSSSTSTTRTRTATREPGQVRGRPRRVPVRRIHPTVHIPVGCGK